MVTTKTLYSQRRECTEENTLRGVRQRGDSEATGGANNEGLPVDRLEAVGNGPQEVLRNRRRFARHGDRRAAEHGS